MELPFTRWPRLAETSAAVHVIKAVAPKASQNTAWNGGSGQLDQMSRALGPVSDPRFRPRHRRSRLRGLGGLPQTPSAVYAKTRFGAPVYAPRGGLEKRRNVSHSGPGFRGAGASGGSS